MLSQRDRPFTLRKISNRVFLVRLHYCCCARATACGVHLGGVFGSSRSNKRAVRLGGVDPSMLVRFDDGRGVSWEFLDT